MLDSPAWAALTATQQQVLIAWLRCYVILSGYDTRLLEDGMPFTWAHCTFSISERAFLEAVNRIIEIGFFERAPQFEEMRPGAPRKFLPSRKWTKFVPEHSRDAEHAKKKRERIESKRRRRAAFRKSLSGKNAPHASAPIQPYPNAPTLPADTLPNCAEVSAQKGNSRHTQLRRSDSLPCGNAPIADVPLPATNPTRKSLDRLHEAIATSQSSDE